MDNEPQNELERWREQAQHWHDEAERLRKQLEARQQITSPPPSLIDNMALIEDMARFAEGLYTREQVKRKWREIIDEKTWKALGTDDALVDAIEARKLQRVRDGSCKRERAQQFIIEGPTILNGIATSPKASDKHKIDAVRALDNLTGGPSEAKQQDRITIKIDLTGSKGETPDPKDVIVIETSPSPLLTDRNDD